MESLGKKVVFKNIKRLVFKDINRELFDKYTRGITMVDELVVPKELPKIIVAAKCRYVKRIVQD